MRFQSVCGVQGTQSASRVKNLWCWASRKASVFTPIRRVRSQLRPDVSSPHRCTRTSPAERCPTVLQPITTASPAASAIVP